MTHNTLELNSVGFQYAQQPVLKDISFTIKAGQIGCLLGPSGCGKSTLLRLIAGFEQPNQGSIHINQKCVADTQHMIAPQDRQVGMLFQSLALFPHLSVNENMAYGLSHLDKNARHQRVDELIDLCRLGNLGSRYPHQISGGQRQRVALARAMAPKPQVILLDEPFSSVETGLQSELAQEVKTMLVADQSTALWVTHSLDEALAVADQVGVILEGRLLQWSSPSCLYGHPNHAEVVKFLSHCDLIEGQVTASGEIKTALGILPLINAQEFIAPEKIHIGVNKQAITIATGEASNATITQAVYQGSYYSMTAVLANGSELQFYHPILIKNGQKVCLTIESKHKYQGFKAD